LALACAAAVFVASAGSATAQDPSDIRREVERTNEVLARAREIVPPSRNAQAIEVLQTAVRAQQGAIEQLQAGHPRIALELTMEARRLAFRAIDLARNAGDSGPGPIDLEPRAQRALERAAEVLERARDCAGSSPSQVAQRLLDLAATRLEEAHQAFRERRYRLALDLAAQVDRVLGEVCRGDRGEDIEQLYDNVQQLMERAAPIIVEAGNANAIGMLERARTLFERARNALGANRDPLAREALSTARDLLLQALRLSERPPESGDVDRLLEATANDLTKLAEEIRAAGNNEATSLFDRALEHLQRARDLRAQNRLRATLAELRVARNLAWRAARLAGIGGS
jgi:hypothetical protein